MPEFSFVTKGISFRLAQPRKIKQWLVRIAAVEGREIDSMTFVFVTDAYLAKLNLQYLHHNTFTDILTFDYSEGEPVVGEIYVSIPRIRENARSYGQSFETELRRVMAHGLLHILGYKDKTPRQSAEMRRKEDACLSLWS
jgi:rRNA maturation RNase YbeY